MRLFKDWVQESGRESSDLGANIKEYMRHLSQSKSGKNVETTTRILLSLLGGGIEKEERNALMVYMQVCRRAANQHNPPIVKASEAVKYSEILDMLRRAAAAKISSRERQALDVFVISFCTLSRAHEISALEVSNVSEDGSSIMVRPKTEAKSWSLFKKCVRDGRGLRPATILMERRREAIEKKKKYLFRGEVEDLPISTQEVTKSLKNLTERLGVHKRITAHSARKGAAVELILSGIPLVAIKAWGIWANLDTLEAYVGRAIREEVCLVEFIHAAALV